MDSDTPIWQLTVSEFVQLLKQNKPAPETKPEVPEQFDLDRLAKITGRSKSNLYKKMDEIPHARVGGKLMFFRDEIELWLRSHKEKTRKERLDDLRDIL